MPYRLLRRGDWFHAPEAQPLHVVERMTWERGDGSPWEGLTVAVLLLSCGDRRRLAKKDSIEEYDKKKHPLLCARCVKAVRKKSQERK